MSKIYVKPHQKLAGGLNSDTRWITNNKKKKEDRCPSIYNLHEVPTTLQDEFSNRFDSWLELMIFNVTGYIVSIIIVYAASVLITIGSETPLSIFAIPHCFRFGHPHQVFFSIINRRPPSHLL